MIVLFTFCSLFQKIAAAGFGEGFAQNSTPSVLGVPKPQCGGDEKQRSLRASLSIRKRSPARPETLLRDAPKVGCWAAMRSRWGITSGMRTCATRCAIGDRWWEYLSTGPSVKSAVIGLRSGASHNASSRKFVAAIAPGARTPPAPRSFGNHATAAAAKRGARNSSAGKQGGGGVSGGANGRGLAPAEHSVRRSPFAPSARTASALRLFEATGPGGGKDGAWERGSGAVFGVAAGRYRAAQFCSRPPLAPRANRAHAPRPFGVTVRRRRVGAGIAALARGGGAVRLQ
jgi:hypothetical protein